MAMKPPTYGQNWPVPDLSEGKDPDGTNGYLYGFKAAASDPCQPGKAPVIRVKAGQTYKLVVHNMADADLPVEGGADATLLKQLEEKGARITAEQMKLLPLHAMNLHIHGLHASGSGDHDNVMKLLLPGKCLEYTYVIPERMAGGTLLYSSDFRGKSALQMMGGAFGMFVVEDDPQWLAVSKGYNLPSSVVSFLTDEKAERTIQAYAGFRTFMGNGNPTGAQVKLIKNQWHRVRVSFVSPEGLVKWAEFLGFNGALQDACEIRELAWDGVYASQVPFVDSNDPLRFAVHGTQRVDYAIRCSATGKFRLKYGITDSNPMSSGDIAHFTVEDGDANQAGPFIEGKKAWKPWRPEYLVDLRDSQLDASMRASAVIDLEVTSEGLNGKMFDAAVPTATLAFGPSTVHQIRLKGTAVHPMHIHQQMLQVVQPGGCGPAHKEGEFYDTISVLNPSDDPEDAKYETEDCLVRLRMTDFSGPVVIESLALEPADASIMGWFDVPSASGAFESSSKFSNSAMPKDCCAPRKLTSGEVNCRGIPQCGKNAGWDTCGNQCTVAMPSCPAQQYCSTDFKCFPMDHAAFVQAVREASVTPGGSSGGGSGSRGAVSAPIPIYPWVITGIALLVALTSAVYAVLVVRRATRGYNKADPSSPMDMPYSPFAGSRQNSPKGAFGMPPVAASSGQEMQNIMPKGR